METQKLAEIRMECLKMALEAKKSANISNEPPSADELLEYAKSLFEWVTDSEKK